jgi:hypothetical protein
MNENIVNPIEYDTGHTATWSEESEMWIYYGGPSEHLSREHILTHGMVGELVMRYSFLEPDLPRNVYRIEMGPNEEGVLEDRFHLVALASDLPGRTRIVPVDDNGEEVEGIRLLIPHASNTPRRWTITSDHVSHTDYILENGDVGDYVFAVYSTNDDNPQVTEANVQRVIINEGGVRDMVVVGHIHPMFAHAIIEDIPEAFDHVDQSAVVSDGSVELDDDNNDDQSASTVSTSLQNIESSFGGKRKTTKRKRYVRKRKTLKTRRKKNQIRGGMDDDSSIDSSDQDTVMSQHVSPTAISNQPSDLVVTQPLPEVDLVLNLNTRVWVLGEENFYRYNQAMEYVRTTGRTGDRLEYIPSGQMDSATYQLVQTNNGEGNLVQIADAFGSIDNELTGMNVDVESGPIPQTMSAENINALSAITPDNTDNEREMETESVSSDMTLGGKRYTRRKSTKRARRVKHRTNLTKKSRRK